MGLQRKSHAHDAGRPALVCQCGVLQPHAIALRAAHAAAELRDLDQDGGAAFGHDRHTGHGHHVHADLYRLDRIQLCDTVRSELIDHVPDFSLFVPGSATDGITPNFANTLIWNLGPLAHGTTGSKSFTVSVLDTGCREQRPIRQHRQAANQSGRVCQQHHHASGDSVRRSCRPTTIRLTRKARFKSIRIRWSPASRPQLSVRVFNPSATSQTVTVTFQTSPNRFGIGIPFGTLPVPGNPRVVTIGPHGYAEVQLNWTPISSGHYCILVKIESAGYPPIYTYRNLDVTEDLKPGVTDVLTFSVANPTPVTATINLVVVNTCPGWTAVVNPPAIINAVPGTIYTSTLSVTPPNPAMLGTGCHIDVQGWIGNQLIGGIRRLDVPPVNLPHSDPPWLEKEISTIPTPPISGTVNQVCVELQNPWRFSAW